MRASTRRSWSASWPSGCAAPGTRCLPIDDLTDDPTAPRARVEQLVEERPDAIVYAGLGDRPAERLLAELATALPETPVFVGSGVIDRAPLRFGAAPARVRGVQLAATGGKLWPLGRGTC